jgi:hypothetical protein
MFFDVTTMVAAVAVVLATTAETIAAMSAFFMAPPSSGFERSAHHPPKGQKHGARRSSGQVLNDQDVWLVGIVVANADHLKRPLRVQRDRVAGIPHEHGGLERWGSAGVPSSCSSLKANPPIRSSRLSAGTERHGERIASENPTEDSGLRRRDVAG